LIVVVCKIETDLVLGTLSSLADKTTFTSLYSYITALADIDPGINLSYLARSFRNRYTRTSNMTDKKLFPATLIITVILFSMQVSMALVMMTCAQE